MIATHNKAERTGRRLGRGWLKLLRREKQFVAWLGTKGVPVRVASALLWIIKLALIVAVLYFSLIAALLATTLVIVARLLSHGINPTDNTQTEWRDGIHGFGLYNKQGFRIDPYDPTEMP